jgi:RsiW-degrading membrane proteinase PrsW (M82 family)
MTLASIPALAAVLFCAALFILLYQYLFSRRAPWMLVGTAVVAGILCTLLLGVALRHLVGTGLASFEGLRTIADALPFAILRVGLPEEGVKALAAMLALVPFWRRATPAQAFQSSLFAAVGFAIVENQGYATVFGSYAMIMAFGRGFLATLTHTLLAMIFGLFLMRFAARGWRHWHLPVIGYLVAAGVHALYDTGMLPILSEYLGTKNVSVKTMIAALPVVVGGILLVLIAGLWSLRRAIRYAAGEDAITVEPQHQVVVRRWRWSGNILMLLGLLGLIAATASAVFAATPQAATSPPDLGNELIVASGFGASIFAMILGWVLRQKR